MNRLLLPCLLFLSFIMPRQTAAQNMQIWLDPNGGTPAGSGNLIACKNPTGPNFGIGAVVTLTTLAYNQHTWTVAGPTTCPTPPSFTCLTSDCRTVSITYPCCGNYTVMN